MSMALGSVVEATVASRDVKRAVDFHKQAFGLEVLEEEGPDVVMGALGVPYGQVRFVPAESDPLVEPPTPWEIGPRLLGIYSRDLEGTKAAVEAAGGRVGPIASYDIGKSMSELVAYAPDDLLWTVPLTPSPRRPSPALDGDPNRPHSELHSAVVNVDDIDAALGLFARAGGMKVLFHGPFSGEFIERLIGLPPGASLRIAVLSGQDERPARLELMQFFDVTGGERRERSVGLRRIRFDVEGAERVASELVEAGAVRVGPTLLEGPGGIEIALQDAAEVA
jgi:predicted enzyme related to lactoylglutathione lyase